MGQDEYLTIKYQCRFRREFLCLKFIELLIHPFPSSYGVGSRFDIYVCTVYLSLLTETQICEDESKELTCPKDKVTFVSCLGPQIFVGIYLFALMCIFSPYRQSSLSQPCMVAPRILAVWRGETTQRKKSIRPKSVGERSNHPSKKSELKRTFGK